MLPREFPNWSTVYGVFRQWRLGGVWQQIHDALREQVRRSEGKKSTPTAAIIDSQSVRTAEGGEERGYDAGKRNAEIDAGHVQVETDDGRVILKGKVGSRTELSEAESVAWTAPGFTDVDNRLIVGA